MCSRQFLFIPSPHRRVRMGDIVCHYVTEPFHRFTELSSLFTRVVDVEKKKVRSERRSSLGKKKSKKIPHSSPLMKNSSRFERRLKLKFSTTTKKLGECNLTAAAVVSYLILGRWRNSEIHNKNWANVSFSLASLCAQSYFLSNSTQNLKIVLME